MILKRFIVNIILLIICNILKILDLLTTYIGLSMGGVEANPLYYSNMNLLWGIFIGSWICINALFLLFSRTKEGNNVMMFGLIVFIIIMIIPIINNFMVISIL